MNAIPVTNPATVIETLQAGATDPLSKKKNAVAASCPRRTYRGKCEGVAGRRCFNEIIRIK